MPPEGIKKQRGWCTSEESRELLLKNSVEISRRRKEDPEFATRLIEHWQEAVHQTPNEAEKWLSRLIEIVCPNTYTYNVGSFVLGGKIPDFINCKDNRVIELFGELFHEKEEEQMRKEWFRKVGYETLVIWYKELVSDQGAIMDKIRAFEFGVGL